MVRKPTKSSLKNRMDRACSLIVRSRGVCQRCGNKDRELLQCCHIYSRANRAVRWDIDYNLLCLCAGCHFWGHQNPTEFTEFVIKVMGKDRYTILKYRANAIKKWTLVEMLEYCEALEGMVLKI